MGVHAFTSLPFILALAACSIGVLLLHGQSESAGVVLWQIPRALHTLLDNKYYMDKFNEAVFARGARVLGNGLWNVGDRTLIDGLIVNGSAKLVGWFSTVVRLLQSGYIYHYAFVMILGVLGFLIYFMPFPFAK
jgi:NADH-quinone oxidoreductase subunit L